MGDVHHLEQFVSNFFPYSQKQLGFDKPATIRFESDQDNAGVMLGKTAYYDPGAMEVVLYTDGRHPKDIMRSLSHELVHHAQNCRGDFTAQDNTGAGYAQADPHLRKMEREAYTKGNLIFRDFEDLIKTGKINIEIDFSNSGEPKMSLKEWKNNEINTKLMKKWGLLKEEKNEPADVVKADDELAGEEAGEDAAEDLEEGCGDYRDDDEDLEEGFVGSALDRLIDPQAHREQGWEKIAKGNKDSYAPDAEAGEKDYAPTPEDAAEDIEEGFGWRDEDQDEKRKSHSSRDPSVKRHVVGSNPDLADFIMPNEPEGEPPPPGERVWDPRHLQSKTTKVPPVKVREGKISVREAREITRRIIERIKKESK